MLKPRPCLAQDSGKIELLSPQWQSREAGSCLDQELPVAHTGNVRFSSLAAESGQYASVKSFGRRQASESRRGTNPRCAGRGLWRFDVLVVPR